MEKGEKYFEINNLLSSLEDYPLFITVFQVASVWIASLLGYEFFRQFFRNDISYNGDPLLISFYYALWIFVSVSAFWNIYLKWHIVKNELTSYLMVLLFIGFIASYIIFIIPSEPLFSLSVGITSPAELVETSPWYFLPKSTEIILQQLLIYALVLSFHKAKYDLKTTSLWCAFLFGTAHLLLVFGNPSLMYVLAFTVSATIAGFIFPKLILKTSNGFMYSYILHWSFYATLIFGLKNFLFV